MLPGQVISGYAQATDLMPTILDLCGVSDADELHGHSLLPMLLGTTEQVRDVCISTTSLATPVTGSGGQAELRTMIQRPCWAMLYGP